MTKQAFCCCIRRHVMWIRHPCLDLLDLLHFPVYPLSFMRNMSIILETPLTLEEQIRLTCKKVFYVLHRISKIKWYLSRTSVSQWIQAFVTSTLDYKKIFWLVFTQINWIAPACAELCGTSHCRIILVHCSLSYWFKSKKLKYKINLS